MTEPADRREAPDAATTPIDVRTIGLVVLVGIAGIVTARAIDRLEDVLGLVLGAGVLALATLPITRVMARWSRGFAIAMTAVGSLTLAMTVGYALLRDLSAQSTSVAEMIAERVDEIDRTTTFGRVVASLRIDIATAAWLERIPELVVVGEESGTGIGRQLIALVTVVILAAFLQSSGGRILDWFVSLWPREAFDAETDDPAAHPREAVRNLLHDIDRRAFGVVRRTLVIGGATGLALFGAFTTLDVPGAIVLATWMAAWFMVPTVGWAVGLTPLAVVAWVDGGTSAAIAAGSAAVAAVVVTHLRRRFIDRGAMPLSVGPYVIGLAIGVSMGGIAGSVIGLSVAAIATAIATAPHRIPRPSAWAVPSESVRVVAGVRIPAGWRGAAAALVAVALGVVLWIGLNRSASAIVWLLIGGFVAVAITRPVNWVQGRFGLERGRAIGVVLASILVVASALAFAGATQADESTTVTDRLPEVVADLESAPIIGSWLRNADAAIWVEDQVEDLPQRVQRLRPAEFLPALGERLVDLFWTALVAIALIIDGRRIVDRATRLVPAEHRRQFTRLIGAIGTALGGYAAGAALVAGINGAVVFGIAIVLGIGLAPVLGAWAFTWNFVPQIGGFVGGVPLIVFALVAGPLQALVASVVFVIYQFVENNLIQPTVIGAAIDVPPWGTLVAAIAGAAAGGVIGAILVTPMVGVLRVVRRELARDDFPGATMPTQPGDLS